MPHQAHASVGAKNARNAAARFMISYAFELADCHHPVSLHRGRFMEQPKALVSPALHIFHIIVCLCTFGFVFPHALMENEDLKKANLTPTAKE